MNLSKIVLPILFLVVGVLLLSFFVSLMMPKPEKITTIYVDQPYWRNYRAPWGGYGYGLPGWGGGGYGGHHGGGPHGPPPAKPPPAPAPPAPAPPAPAPAPAPPAPPSA